MVDETVNFLTASDPFEERYAALKKKIDNANHIVFFGGAGVSTGSGIPDFRSANGLYKNMPEGFEYERPEDMLSRKCLIADTANFFRFYRNSLDVRHYEPNSVHKYLAKLEEIGKMEAVVTQNVDMLHEKAGTKKIYKIHGTAATNRCAACGKIYDADAIFDSPDAIPMCTCGGSYIRPNVVLFGEKLPKEQCMGATRAIARADLLIVAGTSLSVYPAAGFVNEYVGDLIIINQSETPFDRVANIVFREDMNTIFDRLLAEA